MLERERVCAAQGEGMSKFTRFVLAALTLLVVCNPLLAQLSQNSGISSSDTWVAFDMSSQTQAAITSSTPVYNSATGTTSNNYSLSSNAQTFHVEIGYDTSGQIVMNLWPTGTPLDPEVNDVSAISVIRISNGNVTVFDQNGVPISWVPPVANVPAFNPLNLLGSNPAPSILKALVVSNIQNQATVTNSQLSYPSGAQALLTGPTPSGGTASNGTWTYNQSGSVWVAKQAVFQSTPPNTNASRMLQFSNVSYYNNAASDSARIAKGSTYIMPPTPTTSSPPPMTPQSSTNCPPYSSSLGGSQNVVFQHGFFSSGCTWKRMIPWLNQDFRWGTELVPSLNSFDFLANQGNTLINDINTAGGSGYILIGHSQGGLISRYAAQPLSVGTTPIVRGVLTLDTPHLGAPIANVSVSAINYIMNNDGFNLYDAASCIQPTDNVVCYIAALYASSASTVSQLGALSDLRVNSSFLNTLNSHSENFLRAGVIGNTPRRWIEARVVEEVFFGSRCNPEDGCGERNFALAMEVSNDILEGVFFFAELDCWFNGDPIACSIADHVFNILIWMDITDLDYNFLTAGGSAQDGFVPTISQNYPSSSAIQYPVHNADSHMGATKSNRAHNALYQALNTQFHVQTQASCGFSVNPTSFSTSSSAVTSNFNLATGSGCQWSAVSNNPWLSISSAPSGASSSAVSFSVAQNLNSVPRTGTLNVGNGSSSAVFTVQQAAYCGYTLSVSNVAIPPSGGNDTITVNAMPGCPWSAVSNASWITITAGAGGTGTGSFTFSAAPNPTDTDLVGTITVMGQTLTVILGDPIGAPGTGWVKFSGAPQSGTFNPCQNNTYPAPTYCPQTIPNGGTIWVRVGSQTFSVGFGNFTDTASGLATSIASQMNYTDSPLSATVSGSTVTVKSSINGAATNYSLSISYAYDSQYYSSPAFSATDSGPTLTGGTD